MISLRTKFHADVLKHAYPDLVKDVDGFWGYWPTNPGGLYTAEHLQMLVNILNAANRKWAEQCAKDGL